jgi:hypothetical protein
METQIPVAVWLNNIFCFHATGTNTTTNPYMWTIMFAIDGQGIAQSGNSLTGTPRYNISVGSHGNLGGEIDTGGTLGIPTAVGRWVTSLQTIELTLPTMGTVEVPGVLGIIYVLMDSHATPESDMEAGHAAFNNMVTTQVNDFISSIALDSVEVQILDAINNQGLDQASAITSVFTSLFQPTVQVLSSYAQAEILYAIFQNAGLGGAILSGVDPDQFQGSSFHSWTQSQLATTSSATILESVSEASPFVFTDYLTASPPSPSTLSAYYVNGCAWQTVKITTTPIPEGVPLGRWQVTGVNSAWSTERNQKFISQISGPLANQSLWWLSRADAVKLIRNNTNSFFVVGADGSQADVILSDANKVGHDYLTTTADASTEDNLLSLPSFVPATSVTTPDIP